MLYVYIANRWIPILQPRQKHGHPILASLQGARWKDVRHFAIPGFCHMLQSPGSRSPKKVEPSFDVWKNSKTWCLMMLLSFLPCVFSEASFMWDVRGSEKKHRGTAWRHISSFFKLLFSKSSRRPWIWSRWVEPSWVQKTKNRISTRWFNLTFVESPIWRSLWIWTGHLMIPKRSQKIARHGCSYDVFFRGVGWSL